MIKKTPSKPSRGRPTTKVKEKKPILLDTSSHTEVEKVNIYKKMMEHEAMINREQDIPFLFPPDKDIPMEVILPSILEVQPAPIQLQIEDKYAEIIKQQADTINGLQASISQIMLQQQELAQIIQQVLLTSANQDIEQSKIMETSKVENDQVVSMPPINNFTMLIAQVVPLVDSFAKVLGAMKIGGNQSAQMQAPDPMAALAPVFQNLRVFMEMQKVMNDTQAELFKQTKTEIGGIAEGALADRITKGVLSALANKKQ